MDLRKKLHVFFIMIVIGQYVLQTYIKDILEKDGYHRKEDAEDTTTSNNQMIVKKLQVASFLAEDKSETFKKTNVTKCEDIIDSCKDGVWTKTLEFKLSLIKQNFEFLKI